MELEPNTFFEDFTIADAFGIKAIKDTYKRCQEWKFNVKMWTALTANLNWKCLQHYENGNIEFSELYVELYHQAYDYGIDNFKDEDLNYFWKTLD